jgi:hypothetical protein
VFPTRIAVPIVVDLAAIIILAYALYFRRYYRRDLMLAYLALNVGVLTVTAALISAAVGIGLGLGLFGILSIIRLRSDTVTQEEIAYYFVSLALGLLGGVRPGPLWLGPALSLLLVSVMYLADHPRLVRRTRRQKITLDAAYTDEAVLRATLVRLLRGDIRHVVVTDLDLVRDTTTVDVRYRASRRTASHSPAQWLDRAAVGPVRDWPASAVSEPARDPR